MQWSLEESGNSAAHLSTVRGFTMPWLMTTEPCWCPFIVLCQGSHGFGMVWSFRSTWHRFSMGCQRRVGAEHFVSGTKEMPARCAWLFRSWPWQGKFISLTSTWYLIIQYASIKTIMILHSFSYCDLVWIYAARVFLHYSFIPVLCFQPRWHSMELPLWPNLRPSVASWKILSLPGNSRRKLRWKKGEEFRIPQFCHATLCVDEKRLE